MMYFWFGYLGAISLRMSTICDVPTTTMSHLPETDSVFCFHDVWLLASDWIVWVLWPSAFSFVMPVSALSKKLASPRVPLMTLTTESFPAALALPDAVPVVADDEQPVSARARAEAAASPSFSWRFMCGISPCGLWPDDRPGGENGTSH